MHAMDHRSQGQSGRPPFVEVSSTSNFSYVEDFGSYVDDASSFVASVLPKGRKAALVAHSMGGLVALKLAAAEPHLFTCAVVCAPMICFKTAPCTFHPNPQAGSHPDR